MALIEVRARSWDREHVRGRQLLHVEIHGGEDENGAPGWVVRHVFDAGDPEDHQFTDGAEMVIHVANHTGAPVPDIIEED